MMTNNWCGRSIGAFGCALALSLLLSACAPGGGGGSPAAGAAAPPSTGSGVGNPPPSTGTGVGAGAPPAVTARVVGVVHGGQSPIIGATLTLYSAGQPASGTPTVLGSTTSDGQGNFTFSGFSCSSVPDTALLYLVVAGGNAGGGVNSAIKLMAALGPCASVPNFVVVNELTTVAAVYALNAFSYPSASTSSGGLGGCVDCTPGGPSDMTQLHGNSPAINNSFATAALLADVSSGDLAGFLPPAGGCTATAVAPPTNCSAVQKLTALANSLAACVNSAGSASAQCAALFYCAVPGATFNKIGSNCTAPSGSVSSDTLAATLSIARNPGLVSRTGIYNVALRSVAFSPGLSVAPTDWTIAINFNPISVLDPVGIAIDAAGNAWIASVGQPVDQDSNDVRYNSWCGENGVDYANSTIPKNENQFGLFGNITELSPTGVPISPRLGYFGATQAPTTNYTVFGPVAAPCGIAIDTAGNVWVSNLVSSSVTRITPAQVAGQTPTATVYVGGGLSLPVGIAIDPQGNVWVANYGNYSVTELSSAGIPLSPSAGFAYATTNVIFAGLPQGIAIEPNGDVWVTNGARGNSGGLTELAPSGHQVGYTVSAFGTVGFSAVSPNGNVWTSYAEVGGVAEMTATGDIISPQEGFNGGGLVLPVPGGTAATVSVPRGVAVDSLGNAWIAVANFNSVTELSPVGLPLSPTTGFQGGGLDGPEAVAIDASGDVWVTNLADGPIDSSITEFIGAAAPTVTPIAAQIAAPTAVTLVSISVRGASPTVLVGATDQFIAIGTYSDGSTQTLTSTANWTCLEPAFAMITSTGGLATGVAASAQAVTILASVTQNGQTVTGTAQLTVAAATVGQLLAVVNSIASPPATAISIYNLGTSFAGASPVAVATATVQFPVLSTAMDAAGNLYLLGNTTPGVSATFYVCSASSSYQTCTATGSAITGAAGPMALDSSGNVYVATVQGASGAVIKFQASTGPGASPAIVYQSLASVSGIAGVAVTPDGSNLYVIEDPNELYLCNATCLAGQGSRTQTSLVGQIAASSAIAGPIAVNAQGTVYLGLINPNGTGTSPATLPVAVACIPSGSAYSCTADNVTFPVVSGDLNPFGRALAIAVDGSGNTYVTVSMDLSGSSLGPTFFEFAPGGSQATCSSSPPCPINQLPGVAGESAVANGIAIQL